MKNNGIKPKTWEEFSKLKQEIESMLNKEMDNDYLMNLLIIEAKLIRNGKTLEHKTEEIKEEINIQKVEIPFKTIGDEKDKTDDNSNSAI